MQGAARALDDGQAEGIAPAFALGALFGGAQLTQHRAQWRLVMRHHGAAAGSGLVAHHAQQAAAAARLVQQRKAAAQGQALAVAGNVCRVIAGVGHAQALHRRQQVGHRQHRQHIVAAGVDQPAQVLALDDMAGNGEREIIERARDRQMAVWRQRPGLLGIGLQQRLAQRMGVEAGAHLRVKAVAVADGVVVTAGQPGAHAVAVHQQQAVVGLDALVVVVIVGVGSGGAAAQRVAHQPLKAGDLRRVVQVIGSV